MSDIQLLHDKIQEVLREEQENLCLLKQKLQHLKHDTPVTQEPPLDDKDERIKQLEKEIHDSQEKIHQYEEGLKTALKELEKVREEQMKMRGVINSI